MTHLAIVGTVIISKIALNTLEPGLVIVHNLVTQTLSTIVGFCAILLVSF